MRVSPQRMSALQRSAAQRRADQMRLYRALRRVLWLPFRLAFRPHIEGLEHLPEEGGVLLAANHRSFFDSFFQGLVIDRPVRWMAKSELFVYPGLDRLLVRLGAFPVRRGQSDAEAIAVARALLEAGELVAVFPEGTRVRSGLGQPRRGAARLALEAQVPTVPMAIVGTERGVLRRALWHQGERVRMSVAPLIPPEPNTGPEAAARLTEQQLWPQIEQRVGLLEKHRSQALALGAAGIVAGLTLWLRRRRRP